MGSLMMYDPFSMMDDLVADMNKRLSQAVNQGDLAAMPISDIFEEDGKWVIHIHISGLTEDEIDIHTEGNQLVIRGQRNTKDKDDSKRHYIHRESSQTVVRYFTLPRNSHPEKIDAHLEDGILRIEIPVEEKKPAKKISVKKKRATKSKAS